MDDDATATVSSERRRAAVIIALVVAVIVAAGFFVPGAGDRTTTPGPVPTAIASSTTSATPPPTSTTLPPRILGSISRRTVLVVGDDTGREVQLDSRAFQFFDRTELASGLARPDFYDWTAQLRLLLPTLPDRATVVVSIGGNDGQALTTPGGATIGFGDPAWLPAYTARVAAFIDIVVASGHPLIWIGPIDAPDPSFAARLRVVRSGIAGAATNRHRLVRFVDAWRLFRGEGDVYSASIDDGTGLQPMRAADGYHLNDTGKKRLSEAVRQAFVDLITAATSS